MKFRKKPVEVEAIQWVGDNLAQIRNLAGDKVYYDDPVIIIGYRVIPHNLRIRTPVGEWGVTYGDWIIKFSDGEFAVCRDETFATIYELIVEGE